MSQLMNDVRIVRRHAYLENTYKGCKLHPVLQRVYANRGIKSLEQINYTLDRLLDFQSLKDIEKAASIVTDAVTNQKSILIVGDFDADGATSTALVMRALRLFGLKKVDYLVPNRFEYGYGLTPEIVSVAKTKSPDLIITVDNGISSVEGVAAAININIKVVITDHHLPGTVTPDADAIVNPNQNGCEFPDKTIAGVGVAFYLMLAVRACLRDRKWFSDRPEPNMATLLDLVALGTVADVVPLHDNNRILVEQGLRRVRLGKSCLGIQALLRVSNKRLTSCTSQDFGFFVGPRLNAAGRLDNMATGIECLLADDVRTAGAYADMLDEFNRKRREIEGDMLQQALAALDVQLQQMTGKTLDAGIVIYNPEWHQGVVGLLASRIKERFHRPVIAFADAGNDEIKGSARSIPGLHIRDVLDVIATSNPGLIQKFGGHAMAAGLSLNKGNYEKFSHAFNKLVGLSLTASDLEKIIETDGDIKADEMTLEVAELIRDGGPWGQQFPEPIFDDEFDIIDWRIVGNNHLKLQLKHKTSARSVDAIAFNKKCEDLPENNKSIRAAFRMDVNEFRDRKNLQLIIEHIETTA